MKNVPLEHLIAINNSPSSEWNFSKNWNERKYQTPYVKCEGWGNYKSVGEFETLIQEALEERGFEFSDSEWDDDEGEGWFKINFE